MSTRSAPAPAPSARPAAHAVDLRIGGMTCASCAARIEKKLNRMPGVSATVNFATESAHVVLPEGTPVEAAIATVEATGYTATPAATTPTAAAATDGAASTGDGDQDAAQDAEVRSLRQRLMISAVLTAPVLALAMIPALQFDNWQWLSLTLAAPVVVWGAWPFHRARGDQRSPRRGDHGHADQPRGARRVRLVAVCAVLRRGRDAGHADALRADPRAGIRGRTRSTSRSPPRSRCSSWPAATWRPGPRSGPGRRCARCWSWARRTWRCCATAGSSASRSTSSPSGTGSWSGPGRRSPPTARSSRDPPRWTPACSPANRCRSRSAPATRWSAPRSTPAAGWSCGPPGSARTPSSRRSPAWSQAAQSGKAPVQRLADRVSAVFVPVVIALSLGHARLLAGRRGGRGGGVHRRGRRADHRLPVRAGAGHADRAAGRHRPRRAAGHPDQGPADPGVHPPGRHRRAGQDRHRHHRADEPGRRRRRPTAPTRSSCWRWPARSRTPPSTRSPPRSPPGPATGSGSCRRCRTSPPPRAWACRASSTVTRWSPDGRLAGRAVGAAARRPAGGGPGAGRGGRADRDRGRLGRRRARHARRRRHRQTHQRPGGRRAHRARVCARCC